MKTRKNKTILFTDHPYIAHIRNRIHSEKMVKGNNKFPSWKLFRYVQKGGREKSVIQDGYQFLYDEEDGKDGEDGAITCVSKNPKKMCFNIGFSKEEGIYININSYRWCAENKLLPENDGVLIILKAILKIILSKPTINHYNQIILTDYSSILCKKNDVKYYIRLMDMYFICTGCTWYSSLAPMFIKNKVSETNFIRSQERILELSWNTFIENIPKNVSDELTAIQINTDAFTHTDRNSKGSASKILNEMRIYTETTMINGKEETNHTYCSIFYDYMYDILNGFNIQSLNMLDWGIILRNGKIIACNQDPIHNRCVNKKRGWVIPANLLEYVSAQEYKILLEKVQI